MKLTDLFIQLVHQECSEFGFELITPLDHKHRGSHVSYRHEFGYEIIQALIARGVIGDYQGTCSLEIWYYTFVFGL